MIRSSLICTLLLIFNVGFASAEETLYVSSEKDNGIVLFDANTLEKFGFIETGERPRSIIFNKDRSKIFVATGDSDVIEVVDVSRAEVIAELKVGEDPEMAVLSIDGNYLYSSLEEDGELSVFDLRDESVRRIEVGEEPEGVLAHPDGKHVYVTSEEANLVQVVDVDKGVVTASITVGNRPRRFAFDSSAKELWVTNEMSGSVSVIDVGTNSVVETISFLPKGFRKSDVTPVGILFDVPNDRAYVTLGRANHVAVLELSSKQIERYILVGSRAWGIALDQKRDRILVANGLSDDMSVIDTNTLKVVKTVQVARVPHTILLGD